MTAAYPRVQPRPALERVLARVVVADGGCWIFTGARNRGGYGVVGLGGRGDGTALTHRVTWEAENGPVPDGHDLDHLCRVRACCNPTHLESVTRQTNVDRGARSKGYGPRERSTCPRNHVYDAVVRTADGSIRQRRCNTCRRQGASS